MNTLVHEYIHIVDVWQFGSPDEAHDFVRFANCNKTLLPGIRVCSAAPGTVSGTYLVSGCGQAQGPDIGHRYGTTIEEDRVMENIRDIWNLWSNYSAS
jgi:hypothetical protein